MAARHKPVRSAICEVCGHIFRYTRTITDRGPAPSRCKRHDLTS